MTEYRSPVPNPSDDVRTPEVCREIYPMPMFGIIPTADLQASKDFWIDGLGFIDLFSVPGQVTHLRRWAFQDVLLVPGEPAERASGAGISFSCVRSQIDEILTACQKLRPGCAGEPELKPWNSLELTVVTPENARVVMTAALPLEPGGAAEEWMREIGIQPPTR